MARDRANVYLTIWTDPDFRSLSVDAQWLYFVMLTHESLNYCGVMDWRPARLSHMVTEMTVQRVEAAAWELGQRRMIAVDEHTEEALVRSFVRHDGVLKQPNPTKGMVREFGGIASVKLMELVAREVRRAFEENPDWKGRVAAEPVSKQFPEPFEDGFEWVPNRFALGSPNPSDLVPKGFALGSFPEGSKKSEPFEVGSPTSTSTSTSTYVERGAANADAAPPNTTPRTASKKIPLPDNWEPKDRHRAKAKELGIDLDWEVQKFKNDALAKGKRFVQWDRALDTWLQRAVEYGTRAPNTPATHRSTTDDRVQGWLALANQNDDDDRKELTA